MLVRPRSWSGLSSSVLWPGPQRVAPEALHAGFDQTYMGLEAQSSGPLCVTRRQAWLATRASKSSRRCSYPPPPSRCWSGTQTCRDGRGRLGTGVPCPNDQSLPDRERDKPGQLSRVLVADRGRVALCPLVLRRCRALAFRTMKRDRGPARTVHIAHQT